MSAKKEAKKAWCYFDYESYVRPERKDDFKENIKRLSKEGKVCYKHLAGEDKLFLPCEYEILENGEIEVKVECYALKLEIENQCDEDGQEHFVFGYYFFNQFERRDIFIFDGDKSFLLKKARAIRFPIIFSAIEYFISDNGAMSSADSLFKFFSKTKVKSIKIFAKTLNKFKNTDIFFTEKNLKTFEQYKHREIFVKYNSCWVEVSYIFKESVNINKNNISKISVQIDNSPDSSNKSSVYIQIDLDEAVDPYKAYDDVGTDKVYDYLEEIAIYFQLFYPSKIKIDHVYTILEDVDQEVDTIIDDVRHEVKIIEDDNCFEFVTVDLQNFYDRVAMFNKSSLSADYPTITENILDFLKTCYDKIAYRTCDSYLRNIRHFIFDSSIFIEDSFLCCFRFIELFYKDKKYKDKKLNNGQGQEPECVSNNKIIGEMIKNHYDKEKLNNKQRKELAFCIVRLRDHYSHYGYYLPRSGIEYGTCKREKKQLDESEICKKFNTIESIISKIKAAEKDSEKYVDDIIKACDKIRPILTEIINSQQGKGKQYKVVGFFEMYEKLRVIHIIAMNIIFKSILGYESHKFPMLAEF